MSAFAPRASIRRHPSVEIKRLTEDYCEFWLKDTDQSMSNALRRIIIAEVAGRAVAGRGGAVQPQLSSARPGGAPRA